MIVQREAVRCALQLRRSRSIPREQPLNVYDLATALGIHVQFMDLTSLEGMFYRGPQPTILLPTMRHRFRGRVAYSCAHEMGHFELGHASHVDEYAVEEGQPSRDNLEELAADTFAASLLMPRPAVASRFNCRDVPIEKADSITLLTVAGELDVGYTTLLRRLRYGLELVDNSWLNRHLKAAPKQIREQITGRCDVPRVLIIDHHWPPVPLDMEIGDCIATKLDPPDCELIDSIGQHNGYNLLQAAQVGQARIRFNDLNCVLRVARFGYSGHFKFRYLPEPEVE